MFRAENCRAVLCAVLLLCTACRTTRAPVGFRSSPEEAAHTTVGAWTELIPKSGRGEPMASGELVAVTRDTVFLFNPDTLVAVPLSAVQRVQLLKFNAPIGTVAAWGVLGTISTLSHGFWLVISAPAWIITSTATGVWISRAAIDHTVDPGRLAPHARFPQGLDGIDRRRLLPARVRQ